MSNIPAILTRWGVWARDNNRLDYPHIASGFKEVVSAEKQLESCSDNDGLAIDVAVGYLKRSAREKELELIIRYYVYGQSKASIARLKKCNEREIRRQLQIAESFIDGYLAQSNISLEMY